MGSTREEQEDFLSKWRCPECNYEQGVDICEFVPMYTSGSVKLVDGRWKVIPDTYHSTDLFYEGIDGSTTEVHCMNCRRALELEVVWS